MDHFVSLATLFVCFLITCHGATLNLNPDACADCENGASCEDGRCICPARYRGQRCEIDQYHSGQDGDYCMPALHFDCSDSDWLTSGIKCVDRELMCNGHFDCTNGADEHLDSCECFQKNEFMCEKGECVPRSKLCDGLEDCSNGLDEDFISCMSECESQFRCITTGQCIEPGHLCTDHYGDPCRSALWPPTYEHWKQSQCEVTSAAPRKIYCVTFAADVSDSMTGQKLAMESVLHMGLAVLRNIDMAESQGLSVRPFEMYISYLAFNDDILYNATQHSDEAHFARLPSFISYLENLVPKGLTNLDQLLRHVTHASSCPEDAYSRTLVIISDFIRTHGDRDLLDETLRDMNFDIYPVILPKASSPETIRLLQEAGYQGANLKDGLSSFVEDFTKVMRNVFI